MQQVLHQQYKPKRKRRSLGFWIAFSLALLITTVFIIGIIWLWTTQNFDKLASVLGVCASIVAIVTGPLMLLFTISKFPEREKIEENPTTSSPALPSSSNASVLRETEIVWNVLYRQNPFFTGRENILAQLHDNLTGGKATTLTQPQTINGLGGVGKTQCAVEYAYRYKEEYHYVLWVNAVNHETLTASFVALASLLQLEERNEAEQSKVVTAVTHWLETHQQWLLILDNADNIEMTFTFLPTIYTGHILLTSRNQAGGGLTSSLEIREMDVQEGALMLLRRAKMLLADKTLDQATFHERQQAEIIVKLMDGLPLALDQAGAYIEENHSTLQEYVDAYQHRQADLLQRRGAYTNNHPDAVATTWSLSFEALERNNPLAVALLRACAFLAPDDIPEELFVKGANKLGPSFQSLANDPTLLQEAVGKLLSYSLIRRSTETQTLFVHRLVQAVIQHTTSQEDQRQWVEQIIKALDSIFPKIEPTTWAQCQRYLFHILACFEQMKQWNITTPETAHLLNATGSYLLDHAQYADAEPLLQHALQINEQQLGSDHLETARSLNNLALLYKSQSKYEQAEVLSQHVLQINEQQLGSDHPNTATSLNNLGLLYCNQGKYEQAEPLLQRALQISEQWLGPIHPDTATSLNNLALLYDAQGKYEQAETLYRRALQINEQQLGSDHPDTATNLDNLARLYCNQGKYEQAEPLLQCALHIREQQLGPDHPETALSLNNLAALYDEQGKYEQAEALYRRALQINKQQLGPDHPYTAISLNNLATLSYYQGKYEQAEPLLQRALQINEQQLGSDNLETARSLNNLARLYSKQGKYEQAESLLQRALHIREQQLGPNHPNTAISLNNLGLLYCAQGKYEQAEPLLQRAVCIYEQQLGFDHPNTTIIRANYIGFQEERKLKR